MITNNFKYTQNASRNSSIEVLKIFAICMIVLNHSVQTIAAYNLSSSSTFFDLSCASVSVSQIVLSSMRYLGVFGDDIFLVCSVWFFLENDKINIKKIFTVILDVWIISFGSFVVCKFSFHNSFMGLKSILPNILPLTFANCWYITCYVLLYLIHPLINKVIACLNKYEFTVASILLCFLYIFCNFIRTQLFFYSELLLWISIYFIVGYIKKYLEEFVCNVHLNVVLSIVCVLMNILLILFTNYLGLKIEFFSNKVLYWANYSNPFLILSSICLLNIGVQNWHNNEMVNFFSSLSLQIYCIHDNKAIRETVRPLIWEIIHLKFGTNNTIIVQTIFFAVVVLVIATIFSCIYKLSLGRLSFSISELLSCKINVYLEKLNRIVNQD